MNKKFLFSIGLGAIIATSTVSCSKSSFDDNYRDPNKMTSTNVEKQFEGMIYTSRELVVPSYWNYFVILRTTAFRYVQATGWANEPNQYVTGAAAITDRWTKYYSTLAQYRELEKVYATLPEVEQDNYKVFMDVAKIYFYDLTQQVVDLHGSIPWTKAGMLNTNGNYASSYATYDKAEDVYSTMLDDLKAINNELSTITVTSSIAAKFKRQDVVNGGDVSLWRKYCNSLRLRMLNRVSSSSTFQARAKEEISEIINNPSASPLILTDGDNAQIDVTDISTDLNAKGLRDGLETEGWYSNIVSKAIADQLIGNNDPRISYILEPGANAAGVYRGLDQSLASGAQTTLMTGGTISIYNRSTYSRNNFFPGILISASEVNFILAEYFNRIGDNATAKTYFENAIKESITMYQNIRSVSADNLVSSPTPPTAAAIQSFITNLNWDNTTNKLALIMTQKWLHFNIIQPLESWADIRRTGYPALTFPTQSTDVQLNVPLRWVLPSSESVYNATNYATVSGQDKATNPLFWDVN